MLSNHSIAHGWNQTKKFAGRAWHHATGLAKRFDHGMQVGRRLLGAISPLLDQLNVNYRPAIQGIAAYDQGKADVMYGVNNVMTTMQRVRRQVPELEL